MKYVCLIFPEAPASGGSALDKRSTETGGDLRARIVMGAQAIGAANSAVTVRVRGVEMSIVEGAARLRGEPSPR